MWGGDESGRGGVWSGKETTTESVDHGGELEVQDLQRRISEAVQRRNRAVEAVAARARLRRERRGAALERMQREVEEARSEVKQARRAAKRYMKQMERKWWGERIEECREA